MNIMMSVHQYWKKNNIISFVHILEEEKAECLLSEYVNTIFQIDKTAVLLD